MTIPPDMTPDPPPPTYDDMSTMTSAATLDAEPSPPPTVDDEAATTDHSTGAKAMTAGLIAGATALANKVRQEAPKKVQEIRQKRAAGRCVILTQHDGHAVAVGPYPNHDAAQADRSKAGMEAQVVELMPESAFFDHQT